MASELQVGKLLVGNSSTNELLVGFESSSQDFSLGANGTNFMVCANATDLDNNELLRISSTGLATFSGGIALQTAPTNASATANEAYTLDKYETGTWTPVAKDKSSSGDTGTVLNTSLALGTYVRVGKIVYCTFRITRNDTATLTNSLYLSGLPFDSQNNVQTKNIGIGSTWLPDDDVAGFNYALENTDEFLIRKNDASGYVTTNLLTNTKNLYGALTYEADV